MTRTTTFLALLIAFITGIAFHTLLPYAPSWYAISATALLLISIAFFLVKRSHHLFLIPLLLTFLLLGISRGQYTIHIPSPETVDYYVSEESKTPLTLIGTIAEEPDVRRDKINYTISVESIISPSSQSSPSSPSNLSNPSPSPVSGFTLISTGKYPRYEFGDRLEITGNLIKPAVFDTFDYAGYLSRFDIYSVMYRPAIDLLPPASNFSSLSSLYSILLSLKSSFESHLNRVFPTEPSNSLMAGLLLGSRKGMPENLQEDFRITGLTHIIAISGYNITLIVSILMAIFKPFGKRISLLLSALGIVLFTLFVGASPAVVRACVMGLIAIFALSAERKGNISIILALSAAIMVGWNPKILIHDVGFQLSFLATMGLIYVSPLIEPYLQWLTKKLAIRDSILLTTSAQIMALPVILLNFHNLSIISPLSNLLVAGPFIPFSMLFGFLGTMTSYLWLPLGKLVAFPGYLLTQYITTVIHTTARVPFAAVEISWFSRSLFFLYFIALSAVLLHSWQKRNIREKNITDIQLSFQHLIAQRVYIE